MANTKISELTAAGALAGTEQLPVVQGGATVRTTVSALLALLSDAAPATLDTLNELAAALGDDANFAATITTALAGKQGIFDLVAGQYTAPFATATTTNFGPEGFVQGSPLWLPGCTLDRIGVDITTAGGVGALYRLGIYDENLNRVLDAGTVDATSTGIKEITINQVLPAGIYWLVGCQQGAAASNTTVRQNSGAVIGCASTTAAGISGNSQAGWTLAQPVTGALPATGAYSNVSTRVVRVFVRAA